MTPYLDRLRAAAEASGTLLCLGLDPVPERIARVDPGAPAEAAGRFLEGILAALEEAGVFPAALKPNLACFEQYGRPGLALLERLLSRWRERVPVILDAKRGDIGRSSAAYARACFDIWGADAVTLSPWMGRDSLEPFLERCPERGAYLLLLTSNPGSEDLQRLPAGDGRPLWRHLAERLAGDWHRPGVGAVVGATHPGELAEVAALREDLPLLVPGVGAQGGCAGEVAAALGAAPLHRVNVSSAVLYAFEAGGDYRQAAVAAARRFAGELALW